MVAVFPAVIGFRGLSPQPTDLLKLGRSAAAYAAFGAPVSETLASFAGSAKLKLI